MMYLVNFWSARLNILRPKSINQVEFKGLFEEIKWFSYWLCGCGINSRETICNVMTDLEMIVESVTLRGPSIYSCGISV